VRPSLFEGKGVIDTDTQATQKKKGRWQVVMYQIVICCCLFSLLTPFLTVPLECLLKPRKRRIDHAQKASIDSRKL
jgi:hypothetical protein